MLGHPVELGHVVDSEALHCSGCCQMQVKSLDQVFTAVIRAEDFDGWAVLLSQCPCLELLVCLKGLGFCVEEICDCVLSSVVSECDKISAALLAGHRGWFSNTCMDLLTKMLGLRANASFWHSFASCMCKQAGITWCLLRVRVQFDP